MGEPTDSQEAQQYTDADRVQYLTFLLGGESFAIGILNVKEIIEYSGVSTVPMMPGFVRGVINLRGAVVPVVDLAARFGGQQSEITKRSCIVIIEVLWYRSLTCRYAFRGRPRRLPGAHASLSLRWRPRGREITSE